MGDMKVFDSTSFELTLPVDHRFPMRKYGLLSERVRQELPEVDVKIAPSVEHDDVIAVHKESYVERVYSGDLSKAEVRRIGFPWSRSLVERSLRSVGATVAASVAALEDGVSVNLAGGTHHAHPDFGAGYCVFNDIAIAAQRLLNLGQVRRIAIIDCDVHQGDGTARIFQGHPQVVAASIHGADNYPFNKARSHLDIPLPKGAGDREYARALSGLLKRLEDYAPEFVFYLAGADPYEADSLGHLSLSKDGLFDRDQSVLNWSRQHQLPVSIAMGGGYARNVSDIVDIHFNTVQLALVHASAFNGIM